MDKLYLRQMSQNTRIPFLRYAFGKKWGRTEWWKFSVIHIAALLMLGCFFFFEDATKWVCPIIGVIILTGSWNGTYKNWLLDRDGLPTSPKHHMDDVWFEGTERPVIKDTYEPVRPIEKWYQAVHQVSEQEALRIINTTPTADISVQYEKYLQTFKH